MYKHSTTHRTLSRRLAALLAVLALLAAMALPVYAEALEDATGTAQAEIGDTISDGTVTTENEPTTPAGEEETEDSTANADGDNAVDSGENTDEDVTNSDNDEEDTPTSDTESNSAELEDESKPEADSDESEDAEENEEADTLESDFALYSDATIADYANFDIYFLLPASWTKGTEIFFEAVKSNNSGDNYRVGSANENGIQKTGKMSTDGRPLYKITIKNKDQTQCPHGGYKEFKVWMEGVDSRSILGKKQNDTEFWLSAEQLADEVIDLGCIANNQQISWENAIQQSGFLTPISKFKCGHTLYAGQAMRFRNESSAELKNVEAVFYDKETDIAELKEVSRISLGDIAVGATSASFKIPSESCAYIQFWSDNAPLSVQYNFYGESNAENHFIYNAATACYFVYYSNESANGWTGGTVTKVYFDATYSKLSYAGTKDDYAASMPSAEQELYCYFADESGGSTETRELQQLSGTENIWYIDVPSGYTKVRFAAWEVKSDSNKVDLSGASTDLLDIPTGYNEPCFVANTNDNTINGGNRGGYWTEKEGLFHDAEAARGKDIVDIKEVPFVKSSSTKYITSTLYDYYSDWELNGNNRDSYPGNFTVSQLSWVPFRQFDQAISDYYTNSGSSIKYPIYTGHFQPDEFGGNEKFSSIAGTLNLYGWEDNYPTFMAANNSHLDATRGEKKYSYAFQEIVGKTLVDGNPVMNGTNGATNLVEPHFNEDFLTKTNSKNAKLGEVYHDVAFPFTKAEIFGDEQGVNYWWFDSAKTSLYLRKDGSKLYLGNGNNGQGTTAGTTDDRSCNVDSASKTQDKDGNKTVSTDYGFFPFNETATSKNANTYNYGYGAKLEIPFTLTSDGTVKDNDNKSVPIRFYFSGDDDVWVFIDNKLVLDIGGAHGKVSGVLEFDKKEGNAANTITSYVSQVKKNNKDSDDFGSSTKNSVKNIKYTPLSNNENYYKASTVEIPNLYTGEHTLTMYYMERGMWESNMAVAFNFPDNNELQVEKKVELGDVKDEFAACFTNQKLFNFTILNQATHYGATSVDESSYQQAKPIKLSDTGYKVGRMGGKPNDSNNYCKFANDPDPNNTDKNTGQVIHWYAKYNDTGSDYRKDRMGVITLDKSVNITGMDYLSFFLYASGKEGEGTLSLSNMYLQLVDSKGNVLGCIDKQSLSGTTYNQVDPVNNKWINIKLDLSRLAMQDGFNKGELVAIRIGDNYQRDIYFKDFTFTANPTVKKITGFTTEQNKIPDYGSAETGELKPAVNAQFSSSVDGKTRAVDENGQFTLQDKEVVTFSDQFRRGSYLSVTEDADPALFETTWTIYENGVPVTFMNNGTTVQNADTVPGVVEQPGYTPNDGRTEYEGTDAEKTGNKYQSAEKPKTETIVFRSYSSPDSGENGNLAKLKLQFVNKVKTGSLTIKKEAAEGEKDQIGGDHTYTFTVTFTDVGGLGLESQPIKEKVTIKGISEKTITGIPVGTRFHIEETNASNKANVSKVEVSGGGKDCKVVNGKEAIGSIVEYKQDDPNTVAVATFTNTTRTLIELKLTKKWKDQKGAELNGNDLPDTIYVRLQRRVKYPQGNWTTVNYPETNTQGYIAIERDAGGWNCTFASLDEHDPNNQDCHYEYRVVEGTVSNGVFTPADENNKLTIKGKVYVVSGDTPNANKTIVLTNTRQNPKFNLDVIKKSAEEPQTPLDGVEFTLEKLQDNINDVDNSFTMRTGVTNADGVIKTKDADGNATNKDIFHDLDAGTYRLTETKTKAGYSLLSEPIMIQFTQSGECLLNGAAADSNIFKPNPDGSYTLTLTVLNRKTPALPHTGADAPSLWLLIGLPLAVAGLLILVFRYNKKGGRTR